MALITKIKAGAVSSLSDARFFAGMGVDWLGFDVNPGSEEYVSPELYKNIAGWVTGPLRVAEITQQLNNETIEKIISDYSPDILQVNLKDAPLAKHFGLPIMACIGEQKDLAILDGLKEEIDYAIVDVNTELDGERKKLIGFISEKVKVLLMVTPQLSNAKKLLAELPIAGLALKGGSKEMKTGIKEYDYANLLESLEEEI